MSCPKTGLALTYPNSLWVEISNQLPPVARIDYLNPIGLVLWWLQIRSQETLKTFITQRILGFWSRFSAWLQACLYRPARTSSLRDSQRRTRLRSPLSDSFEVSPNGWILVYRCRGQFGEDVVFWQVEPLRGSKRWMRLKSATTMTSKTNTTTGTSVMRLLCIFAFWGS